MKMTKEQIDIINESINNIKRLCSSMLCCNECPMNKNCKEFPLMWDEISKGDS